MRERYRVYSNLQAGLPIRSLRVESSKWRLPWKCLSHPWQAIIDFLLIGSDLPVAVNGTILAMYEQGNCLKAPAEVMALFVQPVVTQVGIDASTKYVWFSTGATA